MSSWDVSVCAVCEGSGLKPMKTNVLLTKEDMDVSVISLQEGNS